MIVLDTHAWLWWRDEDRRLPTSTRRLVERSSTVAIPAACCLELASLARRGRIRVDRDIRLWIRAALANPAIEVIPVSAEIAIEAGRLPESFPGDPIDRLVYATAVAVNAPLVTRDALITAHDPARVIW